MLKWLKRAFQAAKSDAQMSPPRRANFSPDGAVQDADTHLRAWGRHFEENNDIGVGILDELVNQVIGGGIVIEPMVQINGMPAEAINQALAELLEEWTELPEVTNQLTWGECQRLTGRAWFRDGEHFTHHIQGPDRGYRFAPNRLQYALELIEADRVPIDLTTDRTRRNIFQGVEIDAWHRPSGYRVLLEHPGGNALRFSPVATAGFAEKTKRVPAEQMTHIAWRKRYPQVRGVSIFAPATARIHDIHDLDDSHRIAERTRARMALWIKRDPEAFQGNQNKDQERELVVPQGSVMDDLLPGEDIGSAFSDSPNPAVNEYRQGQLRAVAAGTGTRYSAIARDYNGTYSSQRQELVEATMNYRPLTKFFISRVVRPQYLRLIETAILQGRLNLPAEISLRELSRAEYVGPALPWIDPAKEVDADLKQIAGNLATREQIIRRRGGDPRLVPEVERNEQQPAPQADTEDDETRQASLF